MYATRMNENFVMVAQFPEICTSIRCLWKGKWILVWIVCNFARTKRNVSKCYESIIRWRRATCRFKSRESATFVPISMQIDTMYNLCTPCSEYCTVQNQNSNLLLEWKCTKWLRFFCSFTNRMNKSCALQKFYFLANLTKKIWIA